MWAFLKDYVTFYLHLESTEPPWKLSDQADWSAYAVKRAEKVILDDADKAEKVTLLRELHAKQQYGQVIDEYHRIPSFRLKKATIPSLQV
jgi:hypothetical protein